MRKSSAHGPFYRQLGENIRKHRKARGISQESLATAIGLKRTSLTNIEKGRQHPPLHTLCEIVAQLKIDISELVPALKPADVVVDLKALAQPQIRGEAEFAFIESVLGVASHGNKKK